MLPNISNNGKIGNNLFDSMGLMAGPREKLSEEKAEKEIDDFLYELPDVGMPTLELGDKLLNIFGTEGEDLFNDLPTKKEEEDEVLQNIIDEYNIPEMKETMDETGEIPENIYFFYGGKSDYFFNALEFLRISPVNREFAAFLLSDLGRKTMTQNKLSIHVESGDIFYDNHKTDENFYSFLLSQQNDEAAYVPKKFSYNDTFEKYITSFLQNFSIDDQEKFDLLAFKNSKYLFYRFNDFMKMYGNPRYKLLHTKKMLDSKALEKLENKNKQFLIDKIIQGVEFENAYESNPEKNPEIIRTIESNYKIARRVCQQLYFDVAELFHEYFQPIDLYEQQDIEEDMKINGWGTVENIRTIKDSMRLLNLFQDFYTATGRLPIFNKLLVVPDGEAKPEKIYIYMKQLYDMFKNTNSHGIVSLPFLGLLLHYFHDLKSMNQVNTATTELYKNLSYMTLSGGRQLEFQAVSDLIAQLSFSIKSYTILNQKQAKIENEILAKKINDGRIFNPKIENPLDDVIEIIDDPNTEHKKTAFLYVEPTVQLPDEIEDTQKLIDDDYADLLNKIYGVNDVLKEQKKNKKVEDLIDDVIKEPPPTDDYWWEEDIFDGTDNQPTKDSTKMIVDDIKKTTNEVLHNVDIQALSNNILRNLRPRDNRTIQELIDDNFIPIEDRIQQELDDDDNISLESDNNDRVTIEDVFEPTPLYKIRPPKPDLITIDDIFDPPDNIRTTLPPSNFVKPEPNIVTVKDTVLPPLVNTIPPTAPPKTLDVDINALSENILRNLRPRDDRNLQNLIDDDFIPLDDRTKAELENDDYISLAGDAPPVINIDTTEAWDENKTTLSKPGPIFKISTDYASKQNKK